METIPGPRRYPHPRGIGLPLRPWHLDLEPLPKHILQLFGNLRLQYRSQRFAREAGWDIPNRRLLIVRYSKGVGSATALGAVQSFIGLMALPSPAVGGWIWDNLGANLPFQISAIVNAVARILLVVLIKSRREKARKAE